MAKGEWDAPASGVNSMPMPSLASDNPPDLGTGWCQVDEHHWVSRDGRVWSLYGGGHWLIPLYDWQQGERVVRLDDGDWYTVDALVRGCCGG